MSNATDMSLRYVRYQQLNRHLQSHKHLISRQRRTASHSKPASERQKDSIL